jgi:signal transduction histidine kinase
MTQPPKDLDFSVKTRLRHVMTIVFAAFFLLIAYFLTVNYINSLAEAERSSLMRLNGIAYTLAMQIDGDTHQRLIAKYVYKNAITTAVQDSDYLSIHRILQRNCQANMLSTPIYTIFLDSLNACYFGVTSAEKAYFLHPYNSAPALLMEKHTEGAMIPRYKDEFGTWLSAFAAVKNSKGQVVALVQADEEFDKFMIQSRVSLWRSLLFSLLVGSVFLVLLVRVLQPILHKEQLNKEALAAANIEKQRINLELQQSLEQVTAIDNFRREMIANLSHDLRTPMASVLGYLEVVIQKNSQLSISERKKFLNISLAEANRLNRLVADLFDLSKLESGQIKIEPEPFNIAELAQDILQKYQLQADAKHIKLLTNFPENLPLALADVRWTDRVLQNLMDNALRYVYEGGFVMFTILEEADKLQFKACNSGDPIPEAHLDRVFDRYFKSSNQKKDSTGLGLTVVKKVIDLHGQRVWAESNDAVTTFRFTLPIYRLPPVLAL